MAKICKFPKRQDTNQKSMRKIQENKQKLYIQTSITIREEWKSNNPTERNSGHIHHYRKISQNTQRKQETRKQR